MRILMLSWEFPPRIIGGIARHVEGLAQELAAFIKGPLQAVLLAILKRDDLFERAVLAVQTVRPRLLPVHPLDRGLEAAVRMIVKRAPMNLSRDHCLVGFAFSRCLDLERLLRGLDRFEKGREALSADCRVRQSKQGQE